MRLRPTSRINISSRSPKNSFYTAWVRFGLYRHRTGTSVPGGKADLIGSNPDIAMQADAMLEKGDLDGYAVWKRILRAVRELLAAFILEGNFHLRAVDLDTSVLDMHIEIHDLGDPQVP